MSIKVMSWVKENAPVSGGAYTTLLGLADWADDEGITRYGASIVKLARDARLSKRQCQRVLSGLETHGLAVRAARGGAGRGSHAQWHVVMDLERWSLGMQRLAREFAKGDMVSSLISDLTLSTPPIKGDMVTPLIALERVTSAPNKGDICDTERVTSATSRADATKSLISVRSVGSVRERKEPIASGESREQMDADRKEAIRRQVELLTGGAR